MTAPAVHERMMGDDTDAIREEMGLPPLPPDERESIHKAVMAKAREVLAEEDANGPDVVALLRGRSRALIAEIARRAKDPWVALNLGGQTIAEIPAGAHAVIDAPTGYGKTSAVVAIGLDHALNQGPVIYASLELSARMIGARAIGSAVGATWGDVLRGKVDLGRMAAALPERFLVLDGVDAQVVALSRLIPQVRAAWPGEPVLAIVDYLQLLGLDGEDVRTSTARKAEEWRALCEMERIASVVVSQPSRAASRDLRSGEIVGAQTVGVSGETAQIERGATVTLAIGGGGPPDERGWSRVDINVGKSRYGGGDKVWAAKFHGAYGQWLVGDARLASDVRAERAAGQAGAKVEAARLAMIGAAGKSDKPMTREELRKGANCARDLVEGAVAGAVAAGDLVACPPRPRTKHPTYWTAARLAAGGEADDE